MVFVAGEDATSKRINEEIGVAKRKSTDQSATSTTLVSDNTLTWPVEAQAQYLFDMMLAYTGDVAGDLNIAWASPTGASMSWCADGLDTGLAYKNVANLSAATASTFGTAGTSLGRTVHVSGYLSVDSTAGDFTLRFARASGSGTATIMRAGSFGVVWRV